LTTKFC